MSPRKAGAPCRREQILGYMTTLGEEVTVTGISAALSLSQYGVRRYLMELESWGKVTRRVPPAVNGSMPTHYFRAVPETEARPRVPPAQQKYSVHALSTRELAKERAAWKKRRAVELAEAIERVKRMESVYEQGQWVSRGGRVRKIDPPRAA